MNTKILAEVFSENDLTYIQQILSSISLPFSVSAESTWSAFLSAGEKLCLHPAKSARSNVIIADIKNCFLFICSFV